ncbi:MAG: hypothetical protein IJ050_08710 [Clostridia bacterium]|nr:hypothetical protein [Clostridia bacterium]
MAEKIQSARCEDCVNFEYDDEYECYTCVCDLDSDEMENFIRGNVSSCPYYRPGDEYTVVRKQN